MNPTAPLLAAIEAVGTKCWIEVGHGRDHVLAQTRIDTRDGPATLAAIDAWLRSVETEHGPIAGVGVAAFGPVRLDPSARDHGCVLTTPKPGWQGADWRSLARHRRNCGFAVETDVNAAALAEARLEKLNPDQREAVLHGGPAPAGPLLVIAGAGSGKTNTLAHRVAALILGGADPRRILLLTFSRRASHAPAPLPPPSAVRWDRPSQRLPPRISRSGGR